MRVSPVRLRRPTMGAMMRALLRLSVVLVAIGAFGAVWYAMAGTHGCDQDACDRFDRDFRIYVASLAALAIGLVFASAVGLTVLTRRLRTRGSWPAG